MIENSYSGHVKYIKWSTMHKTIIISMKLVQIFLFVNIISIFSVNSLGYNLDPPSTPTYGGIDVLQSNIRPQFLSLYAISDIILSSLNTLKQESFLHLSVVSKKLG